MANIIKKGNGRQQVGFGNTVDELFQSSLSRFFDDPFWGSGFLANKNRVPFNMRESASSYEMEIVAPGLKKDDIQLNISGSMLTIAFEDQQEKNEGKGEEGWIRQEFRRQSFSHSFTLDESVAADKISARYENGILYVTLPKSEKAHSLKKTIKVE